LRRLLTLTIFVTGLAAIAGAAVIAVPEINPASGVNAIALLSGALLMMRTRRRR